MSDAEHSFLLDRHLEVQPIYEPLFLLRIRAFVDTEEVSITATVDTRTVTTPFQDWFRKGTYKITVPDEIEVEGKRYRFVRFEEVPI